MTIPSNPIPKEEGVGASHSPQVVAGPPGGPEESSSLGADSFEEEPESQGYVPTVSPGPSGGAESYPSFPGLGASWPDFTGFPVSQTEPPGPTPGPKGTAIFGPLDPKSNDPRLATGIETLTASYPAISDPIKAALKLWDSYHLSWPTLKGATNPSPGGPTAPPVPVDWAPTAKDPSSPKALDFTDDIPTIPANILDLTYPPLPEIAKSPSPSYPALPAVGSSPTPGLAEEKVPPTWLSGLSSPPPWASWDGANGYDPYFKPLNPSGVESLSPPTAFSGTEPPAPYVGALPVAKIRDDFPILKTVLEGGQPLIWLDNAATTQKPQAVIDRLVKYYQEENSNVHRGAHTLATKATEAYEEARRKVAAFIGANGPENIVFVRGSTEGLNLVAQSFVGPRLKPGDEILLTELEHHANIVPWQIIAEAKGAKIKVLPVNDQGELILSLLPDLLTPKTKVLALTHVSNALGTITELPEIIALSKAHNVPVVVDAAQSIAHLPLDVATLGVDFLVFSGHKIYGPTGIGVVYGTSEALEEAKPYQGGGNMIADVTFERTIYREPPVKFEAGTANIAGAVGLGAALDYLGALGLDRVAQYEESLLSYLVSRLKTIPGLTLIGSPAQRAGVVSFVLAGRTVAEVGAHLAKYGVALRAGHHCAQPTVRRFGQEGTVRPSPSFYNTPSEIDRLIDLLGLLT